MGFSRNLLEWYHAHKRRLPWRDHEGDPYAVWVSEIMLQQTTVNAVIPFYERWMARFPTIEALAEAPLDDVLKYWAGLGYYARARNLKATAEQVVRERGSILPQTVAELLTLKGIGRYTAGAISSIAYEQDAPILDANVIRVLTRICALPGDPKTSSVLQKQLWEVAERIIPCGEARHFNQALMELGALVCLPGAPKCDACPVAQFCLAQRQEDPTIYPQFAQSKKWLDVEHVAVFVQDEAGRLLIVQRPLNDLWGGLWELPRATRGADETYEECGARAVRQSVGLEVCGLRSCAQHKHVVTNRRITLRGYSASGAQDIKAARIGDCAAFAWVSLSRLGDYALSSPQKNLIALWKKSRCQAALDF